MDWLGLESVLDFKFKQFVDHGLANGLDPVEMIGLDTTTATTAATIHQIETLLLVRSAGLSGISNLACSMVHSRTAKLAVGARRGCMVGNHGDNGVKPFGEK